MLLVFTHKTTYSCVNNFIYSMCGVYSRVVVLSPSVTLMVPNVVGAVTVMRVLLFVLDVSMLREC